ncbi:putative membrane protein [Microcystis aeruginosa TAIHU98]|uniref:Putative membrane protein n=1 Tax=Microcystis aeruginosa TAIHU98 TaxID=1134457 RepID=L7EFT0_MICAE|nr:Tic20 family protein [Microcystis aeruginosa]ELP57102.1 putative membrane protein [Microcystis aeruginosa TAIHU98]
MTWRGSTDTKDRIFAALVYLLPLYSAFAFGIFIFQQIPFLGAALAIALYPLAFLYSSLGSFGSSSPGSFGSLIIFFVLFLAVVRNPRISHFIRFNTMQAILIDILVSLLRLVLDFVARGGANLVVETLFNVVFLGAFAACVYSIIQSVIGKYADIPTISEAAYSQVGG